MADYTQPDVVNKRVRFFDGQFLQDQDFIDEQKYHLDRERRQSQLLGVTGIVSGLMVIKGGPYQVTVAKGVAVDTLGRQLVLATETNLRLSDQFAKKQDIELRLVYQETPSDLAQTGGEGARRWDESPKIVALAPDGTVAVAPDGVSSTWGGPTVLLAKLAVAVNGDVTVDGAVARKAGLSVPGAVGIGTTSPGSDLEIGNFDTRNRYLTLKVSGGNQYRSGVKLWAWQENYGYSLEYDERHATGNGLHVRAHDRNADGTTRLFVGWNGNVGIGTTGPEYKLTVSTSAQHLQLRRESTESTGGTQLFMELFQHDPDPKKLIPEVFPSIRFHHNNRFWHRIEAQSSGFHFKDGHLPRDTYSDIKAGNISATGKLEVTGGGGLNVDLLVNGRLRSNNNDGGLWVAEDRFVGGHATNQIGFWNGSAWRLTVQPNGNVGIGTINAEYKLTVSASTQHLILRREGTEKSGGSQLFLELFQNDPSVPEVFPNIRFHHGNRFWHRIEAQGSGFHFKNGSLTSEEYSDITARNIYAIGKLVYYWGPDGRWKKIENRANDFAGSYNTDGPSDGRLKTALRPIHNALDKISRLDGIGFRWSDSGLEYLTRDIASSISAGPNATAEENQKIGEEERRKAVDSLSGEYIGLIAQDVEAVVPEVVHEGADGYKHIRYAHLTALLIEAVKEQQMAIEQLRARFVTLERATA